MQIPQKHRMLNLTTKRDSPEKIRFEGEEQRTTADFLASASQASSTVVPK